MIDYYYIIIIIIMKYDYNYIIYYLLKTINVNTKNYFKRTFTDVATF